MHAKYTSYTDVILQVNVCSNLRQSSSITSDNENLNCGYVLFSSVDGNLAILSCRHNTDTVSLHVEMFLRANPYFTLDDMVTRLKCSHRVTA